VAAVDAQVARTGRIGRTGPTGPTAHPALAAGLRTFCVAVALALAGAAHAGRSCEEQPPEVSRVQRGLGLALRVADALDASGAQVVVLARAGQDLSRYRLRWSHLGFAYRSEEGWRVVHKLNQCGSDRADLYRQGLAEFFLDDPHEYRAAYAVLSAQVQERLLPLLRDNARSATLHTAPYSMVAYPWAQAYQQSNQWAIETLAFALEPTAGTRERSQAWLRWKGYEPTVLELGPFTRLGARMTQANVAFDDHPNDKRFADRIETVTVDSVFAWLRRSELAQGVREVR
jgi:hypothetical protein